jgi:hypothetical protein
VYVANGRRVGLWQGKWLVRDLLVVCRVVHGVAIYRRRHGVYPSVRPSSRLLAQIRVCLHFVAHTSGFSQLQPILLLIGIQEVTDSGFFNVMKGGGGGTLWTVLFGV